MQWVCLGDGGFRLPRATQCMQGEMLENMSGNIQILRDVDGRKIGEIQVTRDDIQVLRDQNGRRLGEFDPRQNVTRDRDGRRIGEGNLLTILLR